LYFNLSGQNQVGRAHSGAWTIGSRIRQIRKQKALSQGDIEKKTGLLRCYISRVENGFKVPTLETLERFSSALDVPLYRLFYGGEEPPPTSRLTPRLSLEDLFLEETRRESDAPLAPFIESSPGYGVEWGILNAKS
jgi:transcriptional regulator with XRE-family HTH domain